MLPLDVDYVEEYRTLAMRHEVMDSEMEDISDNMTKIDIQIEKEHKQIKGISKEQDRLQNEIKNLEIRIADLEKHKGDYSEKIAELERKKDKDRGRANMVKETMKEIRNDMERVSILHVM